MDLKLKPFDFAQAVARAGLRPDGQPLAGTDAAAQGAGFPAAMAQALKSVSQVQQEATTLQRELQLDNPVLSDDALIEAMLAHPVLINRPIVVSPSGARLCRPSEAVLDILPLPQRGAFTKEDGEAVMNERSERVAGR